MKFQEPTTAWGGCVMCTGGILSCTRAAFYAESGADGQVGRVVGG